MAISIGENMTIHVGQATQIDTSLVRLANLYDIPKNKESCNDTITKMCLEAATNRPLKLMLRGLLLLYTWMMLLKLYIYC